MKKASSAQNRKGKVAREKEYERQATPLQQFFSTTKSQCPETKAQLGEPSTSKDEGSISEREAGEDADVTNQEEDFCNNGDSISEEVSQARDEESRGSSAFNHLLEPAKWPTVISQCLRDEIVL
jgi:hypothetical protein